MDTLQKLAPFLLTFAIYHGFVDGLIGLRPPDQTPHKELEKKPPRPVSPKPSRIHRTQLYSPYDHPDAIHNATVIETELRGEGDRCQTLALLVCSSQLLRYSLQNRTDVCMDVKQFTSCILGSLKENGRREFVTGMVMLDDLRFAVRKSFRCLGNDSFVHLRHRIAKRHGGNCCTEGIMNCAIQTFFKMHANRKESCNLVNFYDVCMNEVSESCQSKSLATLYPVFVSNMKRQCKTTVKSRKRSNLLNRVFSILT
ncbi:uncharacterized protein LOC123548824 [Mercenaria mercenaria]|uniref:uncharacterized protein LOC123548824 n=1 Tax=Mercenaria mercenaria TaxID=6596 RepID=UPI00234E56F1|nr:uncharacterized protein LOC123548824 [Mercenaria mercenaria]